MTEQRFHSTRDADLSMTRAVRDIIDTDDDYFVLTGSYSIEALTKKDVVHNDIDANVFTKDIPRSMARIGLALAWDITTSMDIKEEPKPNRLEFEFETGLGKRDLELQFVEYRDAISANNELWFEIPQRNSVVPTVTETLESEEYRVKSLPFAIATWALRISGIALSQKRTVRQSDIDHFAFLTQTPHDSNAVLEAMHRHPQMPHDKPPEEALRLAVEKLDNL